MASLAVQPQQQSTNPIATGYNISSCSFYVNTITTPTDGKILQRLLGAVGEY